MGLTTLRQRKFHRIAFPATIAMVSVAAIAPAFATEYKLQGSDALYDVMQQVLINTGMRYNPANPSVDGFTYIGAGSSFGEANMAWLPGHTEYQSIAPMSRNFTYSAYLAMPNAYPNITNVIGLDATVFVSRTYTSRCKDLGFELVDPADPTLAKPDSVMALFLGGPSALVMGSTEACSSPARLNAIATLAECASVPELSRFYRPDDNSGNTQVLQERLQVYRFCNGRAPGNYGLPGSNLVNDDQDPVRRVCVSGDLTKAATRCTYYPTNVSCHAGDRDDSAGRPCTQGFLVALSETDPGSSNINVSIANRIKNDNFNTTMGFGSLQAARLPAAPTAPLMLSLINPSIRNIRMNMFLLGRRLFLQRNPDYMTTPLPGFQSRFNLETQLFNWATNRCNMNPILEYYGYIPCMDDCYVEPSGPSHLCSLGAPLAVTLPLPALPTGVTCGNAICASTGATCPAGSVCPAPPPRFAGYACSVNLDCLSNNCVIGSNPLAGICN